jgi:hypothetical protein
MAALLLFDSVFIPLIKYLARKVSGNVHTCDRYQFVWFYVLRLEFGTSLGGVRVVHADTCLHVFMLLVPRCDVRYDFRVKTMFDSCILTPICFVGGSVLFM